MRVEPLELPEVLLIEPDLRVDDRGSFFEAFHQSRYDAAGLHEPFVQDNQSFSRRGVLRGLHAQLERPQGKLVRVLRGEVFDVAVDIRPASATFRQWVGRRLSAESRLQLWIPPGFAHGFCVVSDEAELLYKCTRLYDADDEIGIVWDDPDLGIDWPVTEPLLSPRDAALPTLATLEPQLEAVTDRRPE